MRCVLMTALATAAIGIASPAMAALTFTGSSGSLAASASFDIVGGHLQVTLTNTATGDINDNGSVLQALFFDVAGTPSLTYTDADICGTCTFAHTATLLGSGTDVGAEWAYKQNASGLGGGVTQDYGLSSAGYGIFGPGDVLSGAAHPDWGGANTPPNGGDFGLLSAGWVLAGDSNGFINQGPHIKNQAIFDLGVFGGSLSDISNPRFQYGTALTDTHFGAVPEPATWALMLLGFGGIGMALRRSRRSGALMQIA
jgi:hypothetical protein